MSERRRFRRRKAKPGQLIAYYGKLPDEGQPGIVYAWGGAGAGSGDGAVLSWMFEHKDAGYGRTLVDELKYRGYDITTLRFSIECVPVQPNTDSHGGTDAGRVPSSKPTGEPKGVAAIMGQWPGDETDEEIHDALYGPKPTGEP